MEQTELNLCVTDQINKCFFVRTHARTQHFLVSKPFIDRFFLLQKPFWNENPHRSNSFNWLTFKMSISHMLVEYFFPLFSSFVCYVIRPIDCISQLIATTMFTIDFFYNTIAGRFANGDILQFYPCLVLFFIAYKNILLPVLATRARK